MTIAYLYDDLLNLYGESGNIKALENVLINNKINYNLVRLSLEDTLDFSKYDLVYIGSGTEANLVLALQHLMKYKKDVKKYIESGKVLLATGNSLELFGTMLLDENNHAISGLGILNYTVVPALRQMKQIVTNDLATNTKIIGFLNHQGVLKSQEEPLFKDEGIRYKNFFGTYILGPILVRNPEFLRYFANELCGKKLRYDLKLEKQAYDMFLNNLEGVKE